jgi:hypothetical protein
MATKVFTTDLKVGMFVADLDRPWVDTPFLLQGFIIEDDEQIAALQTHCEYVIVDRARSVGDQFRRSTGYRITDGRSPDNASTPRSTRALSEGRRGTEPNRTEPNPERTQSL